MGSIGDLPLELWEMVGERLFAQADQLNCIVTCAWDVASLAQTSKALEAAAKAKLWPLLGRRFKKTQWRQPRSGMAEVRWDERYERLHLPRGTKPRPLGDSKELSLSEVAELYEDSDVHVAVPRHIFHEVVRIQQLGLAGTTAKKTFVLTDSDLKLLPVVDRSRQSLGTSHLYNLADLIIVARGKHGSVEGMEAARQARKAAGQKRKAAQAAATSRREEELQAALQPYGIILTTTLREVSTVALFLARKKPPVDLGGVVELARLIDFAQGHATYDAVRKSVQDGRYTEFRNKYPTAASIHYNFWRMINPDQGFRKQLSQEEEQEVVRLALRRWADAAGGTRLALRRPEVPEGLRGAVKHALLQPLGTEVERWSKVQATYRYGQSYDYWW